MISATVMNELKMFFADCYTYSMYGMCEYKPFFFREIANFIVSVFIGPFAQKSPGGNENKVRSFKKCVTRLM